jgi:hypothetical protein
MREIMVSWCGFEEVGSIDSMLELRDLTEVGVLIVKRKICGIAKLES